MDNCVTYIKLLKWIIVFNVISLQVYSQGGKYDLGARSAGLATASVTISDSWSMFNNIAGITEVDGPTSALSYQNRFSVSALNTMGAAFIQPTSFGHLGISLFRFGDELFNEQKIGFAFADEIGIVSLGFGVNYLQINIEGVGRRAILPIEFGGIATLHEKFVIGAHITNINQAKVSRTNNERLPTIMKMGLSYRPLSNLMMNVELEKDLDFEEVFKAAFEYNFVKQFYARTGFRTAPFIATFGLGFDSSKFLVDYAYSNDSRIGDIHELSVVYQFRRSP